VLQCAHQRIGAFREKKGGAQMAGQIALLQSRNAPRRYEAAMSPKAYSVSFCALGAMGSATFYTSGAIGSVAFCALGAMGSATFSGLTELG
jgi:hypothetical protein